MAKRQKKSKEKLIPEPQYYKSKTNMDTYNYNVYHMSKAEIIAYFLLALIVGGALGYLFYGGIGKDELGGATVVTYVLNTVVCGGCGIFMGVQVLPIIVKSTIRKRKKQLLLEFRDMLESLNTSLGAGKNVMDAYKTVLNDLKVQYDEEAFIIKELEVIVSGIDNNIDMEDLLDDFGVRSGEEDIISFANVFRICYRKGGDIKATIRNTHAILKDKMEIGEEIETIITANKTEQKVMTVMPIALVGIIKLMSPDFASNYVTVTGVISTTVAVALFFVAYKVGEEVLEIKI